MPVFPRGKSIPAQEHASKATFVSESWVSCLRRFGAPTVLCLLMVFFTQFRAVPVMSLDEQSGARRIESARADLLDDIWRWIHDNLDPPPPADPNAPPVDPDPPQPPPPPPPEEENAPW